MGLFRKKIVAEDFGKLLFKNIGYGVLSSDTPFYHKQLLLDINEDPDNLPWTYVIEILIFALYITFERMVKFPDSGLEIMKGVHSEFMTHVQPILNGEGNIPTVEEIIKLIDVRFTEYGECMRNQKGAGPAWHLGNKAYWNIIGQEKKDPFPHVILSSYAVKLQGLIDNISKDYRIVN